MEADQISLDLRSESYPSMLEGLMDIRKLSSIRAVDIFCGCGGLSLGLEAAGIKVGGFDADSDAVQTCNTNLRGKAKVMHLDASFECPPCDLLVGGPPCQPFSVLGLNQGQRDVRDGFPAFVSAVRQTLPQLWMFENVPGLLRQESYLKQILRVLGRLGYRVECRILNSSDFGVPQSRKRLVVVGTRVGKLMWPEENKNHRTVRDAIGRLMRFAPPKARWVTRSMAAYIRRYEKASGCVRPRDLDPGKPARTVTCRNLSGATGDMLRIRLPDGRRRMLTIREAARLQSFPDSYRFAGTTHSIMSQIGNAVPPLLAWHLGKSIRRHFEMADS